MHIYYDKLLNQGEMINEVVTQKELKSCLEKRVCNSLWGVSVKGIIHLAYDPLIVKQRELIQAGFEHKILIADVHTLIENPKTTNFEDKLNYTYSYFKDLCGLSESKFVIGSSFQYSEEYNKKLTELLAVTNLNSVKKVLAVENKATLGNYVYPAMQALDIPFTETDVVFGGSNQRGTYMYSREHLPKIGFNKPVVLLSEMSLDIMGNRLADSNMSTRITIHDSDEILLHKIGRMLAPEKKVEGNPLLYHMQYSVLPWFKKIDLSSNSGEISINQYDDLVQLYLSGEVTPKQVKESLKIYLSKRLSNIQSYYNRKDYFVDWVDFNKINCKGAFGKC